jgi:dsDNA-binding SOS-regulon protein
METPISKENEFVAPNMDLPENVEKLVEFMRETGGTLEDYVRLNADYSNVDNDTLLREYYKNTKSHLNSEEINFMIEDNFAFDEEVDEERDVRKAKLAYKEEVAKAKQHLETLKSNYYQEIKLRPGTTQEQQKATDFFNRYNEEQGVAKQQHEDFQSQTKDYFTNEFKGFDFKVGEKKFRYGVKNVNDVVDKQLNISNTIKKFLNNTGEVKDVQGYHKAIYAADNADSIAQHFYEQGKSDAVREISAKSNNVSMSEPRSAAPSDIKVGGYTIKSVSGLDSSKLKIKKSF